jgi:hypothetical protein
MVMNLSVQNGKIFLFVLFSLETLVVFYLLFSAAPLCPEQPTRAAQAAQLTDEQEFQQIEDRWIEAINKRDQYVLELVLSPELIDVSAVGDVTTRNQQISMLLQKGAQPRLLDQRVMKVRVLGNLAIVIGNYTEQLRLNDKSVQQKGVFTQVYQNVRGNWLCVNSHRTATGEPVQQKTRGPKKQNHTQRPLSSPLLRRADSFTDTQAVASAPQTSTSLINVPYTAGPVPQRTHRARVHS